MKTTCSDINHSEGAGFSAVWDIELVDKSNPSARQIQNFAAEFSGSFMKKMPKGLPMRRKRRQLFLF
jgi:hypothetical protein